MIKQYNLFREEFVYQYIDSLFSVDEKITFSDLFSKFQKLLSKIKNYSTSSKKKFILYFITSALVASSIGSIVSTIYKSNDPIAIQVVSDKLRFQDISIMSTSEKGIKHIKNEEKLVLKAYKIGDKKLTMGWGHAEPIGKTRHKLGEKISIEMAQKYFTEDLKKAEDGVKRIFNEWKDQGIERNITQDQFDVLVSMAFNMGVSGLRISDVIHQIKVGDYKKAADSILTQNVSDKFPGLEKRRKVEARLFLSFTKNTSTNI